jgi:hypothetical protein
MDSWKVTKIADDDKSGVVLVDNLRPYGRKWILNILNKKFIIN